MARLDCITVQGFKSIRALEDFEIRPLNIMLGANGAGKSNFLSLFRMLTEISDGRLQLFTKGEGGPDALMYGGRRRTVSIEVALHFDSGRYCYRFSLEPTASVMSFASEHLRPGVADYLDSNAPGARPSTEFGTTWAGGHCEARLADIGRGEFVSQVLPELKSWRVFHFQDVSRVSEVRLLSDARETLSLKSNAGNLAPFLMSLRKRYPESYRRIVEAVRLAAPFFWDLVHRQDVDNKVELEWREAGDPESVRGPFQLSDGTLRFICLTTLLLQPPHLQPNPILIDEPELGLHPYALTSLAEMLQRASESRQIIVSTQSADLISQFAPEDVVVVNREGAESVFQRLDSERLTDWLKEYTLGELWNMNILGGRPGQ